MIIIRKNKLFIKMIENVKIFTVMFNINKRRIMFDDPLDDVVEIVKSLDGYKIDFKSQTKNLSEILRLLQELKARREKD